MYIKRLILIFLSILCIVSVSSCVWDRHAGKRPIDQPGTKWVSSDPYVWFETPESKGQYCIGKVEIDDELISIQIFFYYDTRINAKTSASANTTVFYGYCEFSEDTLTVTLSDELQTDQHPLYHLDESIETLVFYRED